MKLYETSGKRGFHTSIATTFGIDFDAYENVMLARFRGAGCYNNLVAVDAGMLSLALESGSELPRDAGRTYTVTPVCVPGVFHPNIVLQFGRSSARLTVSSANITAAGLAGNLEVAGEIEAGDGNTGEARLIAAAWSFVSTFLDRRLEGVRRQVEWMQARTPWLREVQPANGIVKLSDGSNGAFFGSDAMDGIAERFLACIDGETVRRLIVISPYWDEDLGSLNLLLTRIAPSESYLLLDHGRQVFRPERIARQQKNRVKLIDFKSEGSAKFIHAKVIIAQIRRRDHVLYGSANCTRAALGRLGSRGSNGEACFYRELPAGGAVDALGLQDALNATPVLPRQFHSAEAPPDIPLDEVSGRFPGHFTSIFATLIWSPPLGADPTTDRVELLGRDGASIDTNLRRINAAGDGTIRFQLKGSERPTFARVRRSDGSLSAPGIVVLLDELRDAMRDARSRRIDAALNQLDSETDLGLWLLETLNELEAAETALGGRSGEVRPRRTETSSHRLYETPPPERKLSYEQFMAGRRLRSEVDGLNRSSFAGSNLSQIQGFLNRLLNIGELSPTSGEEDSEDHTHAFSLADDTPDAEGAIEGGLEFNSTPPPRQTATESANESAADRMTKQRRANRDQLNAAVTELGEIVAAKAGTEGLRSIDLLRLRAMLMIVATAAWDGTTPPQNSLQVLPACGNKLATWPRLLGKVLFAYFGGGEAAIQTLTLDGFYDQIPDDILECWATCIWAIQAILVAAARYREYQPLFAGLQSLRGMIYRAVALRQEEMQDPRILQIFEALTVRFGGGMGLHCNAIDQAHRQAVGTLAKLARPAHQIQIRFGSSLGDEPPRRL